MLTRAITAVLLTLCASDVARAAADAGATEPKPEAVRAEPRTFRLEGKPAIEDVFGDASDYRRTIDRFAELVRMMQTSRDEFARSVQQVLGAIETNKVGKKSCPTDQVVAPYGHARALGADYLRLGRELGRHHDQIKEYDRLGESLALTPDYRWRVKTVLSQYQSLLTDYREMKLAFHDQLIDELKFAGCDPDVLASKADAKPDEAWPAPGTPFAPPKDSPAAPLETPPPTATTPDKSFAKEPIAARKPAPGDSAAQGRSGIYFYIDNTRCQKPAIVFLDGTKLGEVQSGVRTGFQTQPGPHDLCLLDDAKKECSGTAIRRNYLSEGWTITLRCQ